MKKNDAAYFNLSADDPVYPGSIMFSSAVILRDDHELLLSLNRNVTNFLTF